MNETKIVYDQHGMLLGIEFPDDPARYTPHGLAALIKDHHSDHAILRVRLEAETQRRQAAEAKVSAQHQALTRLIAIEAAARDLKRAIGEYNGITAAEEILWAALAVGEG